MSIDRRSTRPFLKSCGVANPCVINTFDNIAYCQAAFEPGLSDRLEEHAHSRGEEGTQFEIAQPSLCQ
jgi:hypothetical protein